ncbi:NUDIX hydrolase [Aliiroseovarius subalbicans]|uniref:NUDIX hydrolase n=1 Tax=Aliiroseovarius subalbicans TaxID=2925840 RepID=UPI001F593106|nr:NUDIX hydrolase [Aliiroseovarius subalbicans]MCI2398486.1 NUDIX hydrolase [Aliiroseovarius subalbicans]
MSGGPELAALAVVLRGDAVLMVQRGKAPDRGLWGFPGGRVEPGETIARAVIRELAEETGVSATAGPVLGETEVIRRDDGRVTHHYTLIAVACAYGTGEPVAGDDAADARWVPLDDVFDAKLPMSDGVARLLSLALARRAAA